MDDTAKFGPPVAPADVAQFAGAPGGLVTPVVGPFTAPLLAGGLNVPYLLQSAFFQARRLVAVVLGALPAGTPAGQLAAFGSGLNPGNTSYNSTTGSVFQSTGPNQFPFRDCILILGAAAANIGSAVAGGIQAFIGNLAGQGGYFFRSVVACGGVVANLTGVTAGLYANALAVGQNMAAVANLNGVYFLRAPAFHAGNWNIGIDNGAGGGGTADTGMPFVTLHVYELLIYVPPGNAPVSFWQINDLTAGTSVSGTVVTGGNTTLGPGITRSLRVDVLDTATVPLMWAGSELQYDARVA